MNAGVNIFNTKFSYFNCKPDSLVTLLLVTLLQVISNYFDQLFTMFKIRIKIFTYNCHRISFPTQIVPSFQQDSRCFFVFILSHRYYSKQKRPTDAALEHLVP